MTGPGVIVSFKSEQSRDSFVDRIHDRKPGCDLYLPRRRPDVVIGNVEDCGWDLITELAGSEGKIHSDVEFKVFASPQPSAG